MFSMLMAFQRLYKKSHSKSMCHARYDIPHEAGIAVLNVAPK